jgi:natural resistance-associated macrophage protein
MARLFALGRSAVDFVANSVLQVPPDDAEPSSELEPLAPGTNSDVGVSADPETLREAGRTPSDEEQHFVEDPAWQGDELPRNWFSWKALWSFTGPGFLMSIAYIDPGNLESDLQAGAQTGYTILWVLLWSTIMGYAMQMLSAKLGVATGRHLAEVCREEYPAFSRYALWIMAEIAIIGSDIQEVIGSAIAINLLSLGHIPLWAGVVITAVDAFFFLFLDRLGARRLEAFFGLLIAVMAGSFGYMFWDASPSIGHILKRLAVPRLPASDVTVAVGIVGAVIMPHNLYLHSALVQSRSLAGRHVSRKREAMRYFSIESALALLVSLFINVFVVTVFAKAFFGKGISDIGLANAGRYIGDTFGTTAAFIWALGLLAAGQSSTMTGTYTGQFVMGGYLNLKVAPWKRILLTRSVALAPTLLVALLARSPNKLDVLNQWLNILQSIQLPFAVIPVIMLTSSRRIMGPFFVNSLATRVGAWVVASVIIGVNGYLVYVAAAQNLTETPWAIAGVVAGVLLYLGFVVWLIVGPSRRHKEAPGDAGVASGDAKTPLLARGGG